MYTQNEIRTAILKTADVIEENPGAMKFLRGHVRHARKGKACPLAWIGYFLGMDDGTEAGEIAHAIGTHEEDFYNEMNDLADSRDWMTGASHFAIKPLREIAKGYE